MFAHVKFINDVHGTGTCNVPVSYIKHFDPQNFDKKTTYDVFWSPNEEDSPNLYTPTKQTRERTTSAGFYKALILQVADNEEILEEELAKRRVTIVTEKCLKSPEITVKSGEGQTKKELKKIQKKAVIKGKKCNLQKLIDIKNQHQSKNREFSLFNINDHSDEEDDDVIPKKFLKMTEKKLLNVTSDYKHMKDKYEKTKLERDQLKKKNDDLEEKLVEYVNLNKKLQYDVIDVVKGIKHPRMKNSMVNHNEDHSSTMLPRPSPSKLQEEMIKSTIQTPTKEEQTSSPKGPLQSPFKYMVDCNRPTEDRQDAQPAEEIRTIENGPEEMDFLISKEKIAAAKLNVKFGAGGDSQYAKNLASVIWPAHILATRSVSGRSKKTSNDEKKGLTPTKLAYLKGVFRERLVEENPNMNETEQNLRMKNVTKFISEKIMTLNRVSKLKEK